MVCHSTVCCKPLYISTYHHVRAYSTVSSPQYSEDHEATSRERNSKIVFLEQQGRISFQGTQYRRSIVVTHSPQKTYIFAR